jgi:hypothetical protein
VTTGSREDWRARNRFRVTKSALNFCMTMLRLVHAAYKKIRRISPRAGLPDLTSHTNDLDPEPASGFGFQFQRPPRARYRLLISSAPCRTAKRRSLPAHGIRSSGLPSSSRAAGRRFASSSQARRAASRFAIGDAERGKASRRPSTAASLPLLSAPAYLARPLLRPPSRRRTMSTSPAASAAASPPPPIASAAEASRATETLVVDERVASHVDPFLVEALDNPRHRLMGTCRAALSVRSPLYIASCACDFGVVGSCLCGCDGRCGFASVGGGIWAGILAPCL